MFALRGDPLARDTLVLTENDLDLEATSKVFENVLRSWGGEGAKHSSNEVDDAFEKVSQPAPNLNAGNGLLSRGLKDTVLAEWFLVRARDGRRRMDFLRLERVSM